MITTLFSQGRNRISQVVSIGIDKYIDKAGKEVYKITGTELNGTQQVFGRFPSYSEAQAVLQDITLFVEESDSYIYFVPQSK